MRKLTTDRLLKMSGVWLALVMAGCPGSGDVLDAAADGSGGMAPSSGGMTSSSGGMTSSSGGMTSSSGGMTSSSGGMGGFDADAFPDCWNRLWEGCFDPSGPCTIRGTDVEWENGASVTTSIAGLGSMMAYTNAAGKTCVALEQSVDLSTQQLQATVTPGNGDEAFTYSIDDAGDWTFHCDGSDYVVPASAVDAGTVPMEEEGSACTVEGATGTGGMASGTGGADSGEMPDGLSEACASLYEYACTQGCPGDDKVALNNQCQWANDNSEALCCIGLKTFADTLIDLCAWPSVDVPASCQ